MSSAKEVSIEFLLVVQMRGSETMNQVSGNLEYKSGKDVNDIQEVDYRGLNDQPILTG